MLACQSLQEAEACLGRNLTLVETAWLKYSAHKPDYFLYYHTILFLFLFYTVLPFPYIIAHLTHHSNNFKIQPNTINSFPHMLHCYKKVTHSFAVVATPLIIVSYPLFKMAGIRTSLPLPSGWEVWAQICVYVVVEDYVNYWLHRGLHCRWGYERIHHLHHQYTAPTAFAAPYAHWAEVLILGFATFLGPFIVPGHIITLWCWLILRQMEALETHSGYEFPWSPSKWIPFYGGAEYHDYHHFVGGKTKSNFASVFTYCDYIYGTDKGYRYRKEVLKKIDERKVIISSHIIKQAKNTHIYHTR